MESSPFWNVVKPVQFTQPAPFMTISTLRNIESCPLQWALRTAKYTFSDNGYPPKLSEASFQGEVVHDVLDQIGKAISNAEGQSIPQILTDLGGYTKLLNESIERIKSRYLSNPRCKYLLEVIARSARNQIGRMRTEVQLQLRALPSLETFDRRNPTARGDLGRYALRNGLHSEVRLEAQQINWKGRADLLLLSDDECSITDFKTGAPKEEHQEQVRIYGLLWELDNDLNPGHRLTTMLTMSYSGSKIDVSPVRGAGKNDLTKSLIARTKAALQAIHSNPVAKPSCTSCPHCSVRHLCDKYWDKATLTALRPQNAGSDAIDVQLYLKAQRTPGTWDVEVDVSSDTFQGAALLCIQDPHLQSFRQRNPGTSVRVLDCYLQRRDDLPPLITLAGFSEVYGLG